MYAWLIGRIQQLWRPRLAGGGRGRPELRRATLAVGRKGGTAVLVIEDEAGESFVPLDPPEARGVAFALWHAAREAEQVRAGLADCPEGRP